MHFLIDESKNFIFQSTPPMQWNIATVCGAILPYRGRKKWLDKQKKIKKGSDYFPSDEKQVLDILDIMIDCKIEAVLLAGDIGHASIVDAEQLRNELIDPLYAYADQQPIAQKDALYHHLDNLLSKGNAKFSLQDFYKTWSILEVIVLFLRWLTSNLPHVRSVDLRKLKMLIDDQAKASLITLRHFVHFFLWARSNEGIFNCPQGSLIRLSRHLNEIDGKQFLNTNSLFDSILLGQHGAKMDDKYPELKIADLLSNFSRRTLNGEFSFAVAQKLKKIIKVSSKLQAGPDEGFFVNVPSSASQSVDLLLPG